MKFGTQYTPIFPFVFLILVTVLCYMLVVSEANALSAEEKVYIEQIQSSDSVKKARAAIALGELKSVAAIPYLIDALNDYSRLQWRDVYTQIVVGKKTSPAQEAKKSLQKIGTPAVRPLLVASKNEKLNIRIRTGSILLLGDIGNNQAVVSLISLLNHTNEYIRASATESLGKLGDKRAFSPVLSALNDEHAMVRRNVAWALARVGNKRAVEPLFPYLYDNSEAVRDQVNKTLDKLAPDWPRDPLILHHIENLIDRLNYDDSIRGDAMNTLKKIDSQWPEKKIFKNHISGLVSVLAHKSSYMREMALTFLDKTDPEWYRSDAAKTQIPHLISHLSAKNFNIRKAAVSSLTKISPIWRHRKDVKEKRQRLLLAIRNTKVINERNQAIYTLAAMGDIEAVELLIRMLDDAPNFYRTAEFAEALSLAGSSASDRLIEALDENRNIRSGAIIALGIIGDKRAVNALISILKKDEDWFIRGLAARALGEIGDIRAKVHLTHALQDKNKSVIKDANEALKKIDSTTE